MSLKSNPIGLGDFKLEGAVSGDYWQNAAIYVRVPETKVTGLEKAISGHLEVGMGGGCYFDYWSVVFGSPDLVLISISATCNKTGSGSSDIKKISEIEIVVRNGGSALSGACNLNVRWTPSYEYEASRIKNIKIPPLVPGKLYYTAIEEDTKFLVKFGIKATIDSRSEVAETHEYNNSKTIHECTK